MDRESLNRDRWIVNRKLHQPKINCLIFQKWKSNYF